MGGSKRGREWEREGSKEKVSGYLDDHWDLRQANLGEALKYAGGNIFLLPRKSSAL